MAELSPVIVKKTQDTLGKHVKKPNLSDKLLRKPPFKFLHDVLKAVIQTTGFLRGLYTEEELNSENIKDRDGKIAFLQKAIDVVKIATKENISAKPSKIVAGLEPEKTNEFLQAIGRAIDKKTSSTQAVEAVKSGSIGGDAPEKKVAKKKEDGAAGAPKKSKEKISTTQNHAKERKDKTNGANSSNKGVKDDRMKRVARQASNDSENSKTKSRETKKLSERAGSKGSPKDEPASEPKHVRKSKSVDEDAEQKENIPLHNGDAVAVGAAVMKDDGVSSEKKQLIETTDPITIPGESLSNHNGHEPAANDKVVLEDRQKSASRLDDKPSTDVDLAPSEVVNSASSSKSKSKTTEDAPKSSTKSDNAGHLKHAKSIDVAPRKKQNFMKSSTIDESNVSRPTTALRGPSARPPSARPGAPRRRDRNVEIILHSEKALHTPTVEKNANNIVADLADDGENLVVIDNTNLQGDALPLDNNAAQLLLDNDKEQGHLVQQILETQTALSKTVNDVGDAKGDADDVKTFIEKQSNSKQLMVIKDSIQKLTRFISPLGKLLDYIHEDVEAMQSELVKWRQERVKAEAAIKKEKEQTEKSMESFKYQLFEIESTIEDQTLQINSTMANIIENEERLFKMVLDV